MSRDLDMTTGPALLSEDPGAGHPCTIPIAIPHGFDQADALMRLAAHVAILLSSGMPEREIAKRLMRYHPAGEG